ncbi:MAG: hypothetical protein ACTHK6_07885 [Solirubrobacterales bacterium]
MSGVLSGAWKKLRWGELHVERLSDEIATFLDANLRSLRTEFDGEGYLVYPLMDSPPPHWPLVLGDAIHSLRGALDHAMWAMIMRTQRGQSLTAKERRTIQFPLTRKLTELEATSTYIWLDPYSQAIVRELQRHGGPWEANPLRALWKLSNEDKHRLLVSQVTAIGTGTFHLGIGHDDDILKTTQPTVLVELGDRLDNETPIARFGAVVTGPDPQVDVQGQIPGRIEFSTGEVTIRHDLMPQMAELIDLTLQRLDLVLQGKVGGL